MRFGLVTPVVFQTPGAHAAWEETAGAEELTAVARAADLLGYHHLTCSEHVAVPEAAGGGRGTVYWDPLATLSYLAALTGRVRLVTNVVVLGYHHPVELAKRYGTLDVLSGGRLVLGVGVGSLEEEFALLGAPFADRGARADDSMRALRASLSQSRPVYDGPYFRYSGLVVEPHAVQTRVPMWVGGRTRRSLRRAVELGDGWMPFGVGRSDVTAWLEVLAPPPGFEVVLGPPAPLDPLGDPEATTRAVDRLAAAGATVVNATFVHRSADHYLEQLEALAAMEIFE